MPSRTFKWKMQLMYSASTYCVLVMRTKQNTTIKTCSDLIETRSYQKKRFACKKSHTKDGQDLREEKQMSSMNRNVSNQNHKSREKNQYLTMMSKFYKQVFSSSFSDESDKIPDTERELL